MRKHFLILMLLTLLPMASWALTLDPSEFTTANVSYGTAATAGDILANDGAYDDGDYSVDAVNFYTSNTGANPTAFTAIATTNAGQYYLRITGQGGYSGQTVYVSFWISAVDLDAAWISAFDDVYYTGNAIEPSTTGKVVKPGTPAKTLVKDTDYTVTYTNNTNAGTGHITFEGIGNFGGTVVKDFTINKRAFTTDNVLIEIGENDFVYNAQAAGQAPTVTVKDKGTNKIIAAAEYAIKYDGNAAKPKNAKDGIQISVTGAGTNYTAAAIATAAMKYDIKKAALIVTPKVEKDYDGTDDLPASISQENALTLQGLLGNDTYEAVELTGTIAAALTVDDNVEANAATYSLVVDATKLSSANYKLTVKNGTFKINPKPIDIAVENKLDVPYGTSEADIIYTINATGINDNETKAIKRATKVTRATEPTVVLGEKRYALTPSKKDEAADEDLEVLANYKPTYKSTGYLTWTKGELTISLIEDNLTLTKVYDGTVPTLEVTEADFEVDGLAEGDDIAYLTYPKVTIVGAKKDVNTYQVKLSGASYPDDKYNINLVSSQYTITKKTLKVTTLNDQTLLVGQKKDNLDLNAVAFATGKGLATGDEAKDVYELVFNTGGGDGQIALTNFVDGDATKALKAGSNGTYNKGIKVLLTTAGLKNYQFEGAADPHATGKLIVVDGATVVLLDRNSADLAAFINTNKSNNNTDYKTVTFSNRPLAAETWQAYVLPFDVTPAELCANGLGYVIVNVLKPASTASNVKFGYTMQTIPAHTPFIMKTAEAKNMNNLVLADRIIKEVPTTVVAQNTAKDVNFYGNYATKKGPFADNEYVMYIAPGENNKWVNSYAGDLSAMSGYLVLPESNNAPIFTVEDANGTTSILGVTADGRIVEAEGWYTLNGVKLQGVPTQKGIYIHNGKKLVVK